MPALAIIIPTYNRAALVERTLHSLVQQTCADFQVIVVDHGSTDHTGELCQNYQDLLVLSYMKIARDDAFAPSIPRHAGVSQASAPLIAFLDAGMIVPSSFVHSHIQVHTRYHNAVGIGLQHGHLPLESSQHRLAASMALDSIKDVATAYAHVVECGLQDRRQEIDFAQATLPWFFGWTANLSLPTSAYEQVQGFDLAFKGWGLEDLEFCYRLHKQGFQFAQVPGGWGIELPQSRAPVHERLMSSIDNMRYCYWKHRSLAMESLLLAGMEYQRAERVLHYLGGISKNRSTSPVEVMNDRTPGAVQVAHPSLLIGGRPEDAELYDYVAVGDENLVSTPSTWSCSGISIPLADHSLETVVISDIWKQLDWTLPSLPGLYNPSLLEHLVSEIQRTSRCAIFLHSPAIPIPDTMSLARLEHLCQQHHLAYQILVH